jgi:isopentenyl diphosphate isomerase/L-lactate dehydrogenase-like FMN-dependent dehydrogenase
VLRTLRDQLEECMLLSGRPRIADIGRDAVAIEPTGWR